jgi:hypothetical protein
VCDCCQFSKLIQFYNLLSYLFTLISNDKSKLFQPSKKIPATGNSTVLCSTVWIYFREQHFTIKRWWQSMFFLVIFLLHLIAYTFYSLTSEFSIFENRLQKLSALNSYNALSVLLCGQLRVLLDCLELHSQDSNIREVFYSEQTFFSVQENFSFFSSMFVEQTIHLLDLRFVNMSTL